MRSEATDIIDLPVISNQMDTGVLIDFAIPILKSMAPVTSGKREGSLKKDTECSHFNVYRLKVAIPGLNISIIASSAETCMLTCIGNDSPMSACTIAKQQYGHPHFCDPIVKLQFPCSLVYLTSS